ncbi:uncharacterized membrane protein At3g27390-like isoform X2 [Cucurbita moschata]|uniref:Uncharacterized membrane protein At3g27390-like isoform X2 n=1 Tax=Cucurbita moschata TaxID=3662 RepID=A0A6J1F4A0_CUCMO|nr:uncharacterized membrane protein At3g27390-like isoform X2 [Cucurbita moschata]XP_022934972.1 uncharacterized membrane protein At3g27390-like isoform X2 [Cucurbita moschata]XP_022934974.1 uncharacterized membrane protein At3g27390-like isoform X2 [Cucurbita moschata]
MEPPRGFLSRLWSFIRFIPFFVGLLLLGTIKGIILCPLICLLMVAGISGIILSLWPMHFVWSYYSILSAKQLGPVLKFVLCFGALPVPLILWPVVGIAASFIGGAAYGFFSPILATFDAVGESKNNQFFHCFYDGTWDTIKGCFTVIRDFGDFCCHSYISFMQDLRQRIPPNGEHNEIKLIYLPGALIAGILGIAVDAFMISLIAICKSPIMLFKGWNRLFHDLIGREGPFLETICVPFAGLIILLWPLAVVGSVLGSIAFSLFLGAYAGIVTYQEASFLLGLRYIVTSLSIYDEYSNDILDMQEGSCFPRLNYQRKEGQSSMAGSRTSSSSSDPPARMNSLNKPMIDWKSFDLVDRLFKECQRHGETMVCEGMITSNDIEDAQSGNGSKVISIGLPAFCILETLLRSAKANTSGLLLSDNVTEISSTNRPKDAFFDWFFNPLLIIKEQIRAEKLCESEEEYLHRLVLLSDDPKRLKSLTTVTPPESERRQAELEALARRLRGITKSISRYPTFKRRSDNLVKKLSEELSKKNGFFQSTKESRSLSRSRSAFGRLFSQKSSNDKTSYRGSERESHPDETDIEIV